MAEREIKVNIGGDTTGLDKALSRGQANLLRFAKVGAAAIAATGVAMIGLTKTSLANIDTLTKQARTLGLTTSAFQKMTLVAGEAGIESGKLSSMLGLMQRNIVELSSGTKLQTEAFGKLGLSIKDLQGLSPDEQFAKIAASLDAVKDPAEKTALAMEVFGRSGKDAINMLSDYSAKAAEAAKFQEEFGIAVSQFDSDQIEAANDAFGRIAMALSGLGNIMAANVAPAIIAMSEGFISLVGEGSKFRDLMGFIGENLDVMASSIGVLALGMTAKAIPAIYGMVTATGVLTGAMVALRSAILLTGIGALVIGAGYLIAKFIDLAEKTGGFGNALKLTGDVASAVFAGMGTSASALVPAIGSVWETIKAGFLFMVKGLSQTWADFLHSMGASMREIPGMDAAGVAVGNFAITAGSAVYEYGAAIDAARAKSQELKDEAKSLASGGVDEAVAALARLNEAMNRPGMTTGVGITVEEGNLSPPAGPTGAGEGEGMIGGGAGAGGLKGGAGIASDMAARLKALQEGLMTEREVVAAWYEEGKTTLAQALDAELIKRAEYDAAKEALEQQHQEKLSAIKSGSMSDQLRDAAGFFGAMASVVKTGGAKALKASQILSAAQGLINSYVAFTEVLKDPSFIGRPLARIAAAGGVLAAGLNMVQAIKGVSASGGASGSAGGGAASAATSAPAQQPATTFAFTLQNDPMGFGESFARQLIEQLNSTQRNGGQIRGVMA